MGRIGAIISPLVAGALIDAAWRPTQLYMGYGTAFVAAAVIVLLHRLQPPVHSAESGTKHSEHPEVLNWIHLIARATAPSNPALSTARIWKLSDDLRQDRI